MQKTAIFCFFLTASINLLSLVVKDEEPFFYTTTFYIKVKLIFFGR